MKKTPLKRGTKTLKRTSFVSSKKLKTIEEKKEKQAMFTLFKEIWDGSNKRSEVSGKYLGSQCLSTFFHHILPKESYEEYTLCKENIIMVTAEEHDEIHNNIDNFPRVKEIYLYLLDKHNNSEPIN